MYPRRRRHRARRTRYAVCSGSSVVWTSSCPRIRQNAATSERAAGSVASSRTSEPGEVANSRAQPDDRVGHRTPARRPRRRGPVAGRHRRTGPRPQLCPDRRHRVRQRLAERPHAGRPSHVTARNRRRQRQRGPDVPVRQHAHRREHVAGLQRRGRARRAGRHRETASVQLVHECLAVTNRHENVTTCGSRSTGSPTTTVSGTWAAAVRTWSTSSRGAPTPPRGRRWSPARPLLPPARAAPPARRRSVRTRPRSPPRDAPPGPLRDGEHPDPRRPPPGPCVADEHVVRLRHGVPPQARLRIDDEGYAA